MIGVQDLRKGTTYIEENDLWRVLEYEHVKTGRGNATIRVKVRNVRSGSTQTKTYPSGSRVQDIRLDHTEVQYLYNDGDLYYFMDLENNEQPVLSAALLGDGINFMVDGMTLELESYEGEPISVELPTTVELEVIAQDLRVRYGDGQFGEQRRLGNARSRWLGRKFLVPAARRSASQWRSLLAEQPGRSPDRGPNPK